MSETQTVVSVEETVRFFIVDEVSTPYAIWRTIKLTFESLGVSKSIPSQMMYNYARNGLINGTKGQKRYSRAEVEEFAIKYVKKYVA